MGKTKKRKNGRIYAGEMGRPGICRENEKQATSPETNPRTSDCQNQKNQRNKEIEMAARKNRAVRDCRKRGMVDLKKDEDLEVNVIRGIEKREPTEIVSLSIEGDHSYVAGGIIVHNTTVCRAYDGATWDLSRQPIMGTKLPYGTGVPRHFGCRSVEVPLMKDLEEILGVPGMSEMPSSTRSSIDGQISTDVTFDQWMKSRSVKEQVKVLGKGRQQLWADGKLTLADMLNPQTGQVMSLKTLREKTEKGLFYVPAN